MPYSIETKDGITINNIPDDVDPSSEELQERVRQLRFERDPVDEVSESVTVDELSIPEPSGVTGGTLEEQIVAESSEIPMLDAYGSPIMPPTRPEQPEDRSSFQDKLVAASEALLTMMSGGTTGAGGMARGTLEGLADQILSGEFEFGTKEANQMIMDKAMQKAGESTYSPRTPLGQEYASNVADVLSYIPPVIPGVAAEAQSIRAGIAGGRDILRGGGRKAVVEAGTDIVRQTGQEIASQVPATIKQAATAVAEPVKQGVQAVQTMAQDAQQRNLRPLYEILKSEPDSNEVVGYKLVNDKVVVDSQANEAIKQGFDAAVLGSIKDSSNLDKKQMQKMLNIFKIGKKRADFAATKRPHKVLGDSMMERVNFLIDAKKSSGKRIDEIAKSQLRGTQVNYDDAKSTFTNDLSEMGVSIDVGRNGVSKVNLKGSDIEGDRAAATLLNLVLERIGSTKFPDAYGVHTAKRSLDTQIEYGKRKANPLTKKAERVVKRLRRNLNMALGDKFPDYRQANTKFSESIGALDQIQDAVGKKVNFESSRANEAFGTALRAILSNYGSRNNIIDAIDVAETIASKYGLKIEDSLIKQLVFVNEIDRMFGAVATGSFKGQIEQSIRKGSDFARSSAAEKAIIMAENIAEAVRGINEESAIRAIEEILKRRDSSTDIVKE